MHDYGKREKIEWLNYWIEDANREGQKRILLLGDSVTRELRKQLAFFLSEEYAVDVLAMSYNICDDMALEEIRHFLQSSVYQYDYIFYQMGAHHGYHIECAERPEDADRFETRSMEILGVLMQHSSNVIALASTLESDIREGRRKISCEYGKETERRNRILETAARRSGIPFYDLNARIDYERVRFTDRFHFYEKEYEDIAGLIIADFFPGVHCASSNQIATLQELEETLEQYKDKRIYVYGNGIRGERIRIYLRRQGYRFDGFVVSEEFEEEEAEGNVIGIAGAEKKDALFLVTPRDPVIWNRLKEAGAEYISLHPDINTFLRMSVDRDRETVCESRNRKRNRQ